MSDTQVSDPSVVINNVGIPVVPNSVKFTEGFGEQQVLVQSAGGGLLEQVFSDDVETSISKVMFSMRATPSNIAAAREWKANRNQNAIEITAQTQDGSLTRGFANCALISDYEVNLAADGVLELEFHTDRATP